MVDFPSLQQFGKLAHGLLAVDKLTHDHQPGFVPQRLKQADGVVSRL